MRMRLLCALLFSAVALSAAPIAFDASIGDLSPASDLTNLNFDTEGHLWYKFDQMVFLGAGTGMQMVEGTRHIPIFGSLWLRLPFGGRTLPVVMGDMGYTLSKDSQFFWRGGGGLDIKNGNHSSLLLLAGYQRYSNLGGYYYLRGGLLLEF